MRFLADENIEYPVINILGDNNIDILAVRELMRGATDSDTIDFASRNKLTIITADKDFGELSFRLNKNECGIILLRFEEIDVNKKAELLLSSILKFNDEVLNKFIVIDKFNIRIRNRL